MVTLTPTQARALRAASKGDLYLSADNAWRSVGMCGAVLPATVRALWRAGLAVRVNDQMRVTPEGEAWLRAHAEVDA